MEQTSIVLNGQTSIVTEINTQFNQTLNELQRYQLENRDLKQTLDRLQSEITFKDKILHEKAMQIMHCTAENVSLRQQIQKLERKLNSSKQKKRIRKHKSNNKKKKQFKPMPELSLNDHGLPYVMPEMESSVSAASNLSIQACKLSFPIATPANINPNKPTTIISILSPIAENNNTFEQNNNSNNIFTVNPITPMTEISLNESTNNNNIHINEWNQSIATPDLEELSPTPSPTSAVISDNKIKPLSYNNINHLQILSDVSDISDSDDTNNSITYTEYESVGVSYMTDNTHLILDMDFGIRKFNLDDYSNSDGEVVQNKKKKVFVNEKNNFMTPRQYNGCDHVITSPISMINLLEAKVSNSNSCLNEYSHKSAVKVDNNNVGQCMSSPDNSKYAFPQSISVLSEFTDVENDYQFNIV